MYTREQVESTVKSKGYKWFEDNNNKSYDVNIVGIRNSKTKNRVTNAFDDKITISYSDLLELFKFDELERFEQFKLKGLEKYNEVLR